LKGSPRLVLHLLINHLSRRFMQVDAERRKQFLQPIAPIKGEITRLRQMVSDIQDSASF
jgi:hypothetical protein